MRCPVKRQRIYAFVVQVRLTDFLKILKCFLLFNPLAYEDKVYAHRIFNFRM